MSAAHKYGECERCGYGPRKLTQYHGEGSYFNLSWLCALCAAICTDNLDGVDTAEIRREMAADQELDARREEVK